MPFEVKSRSHVQCLCTNSQQQFQTLPIFCHKELHLRCCKGLDQYCMLHRSPMTEYNLGKICKTYPPRCPKNTFPEVFYIKLSKLASTH